MSIKARLTRLESKRPAAPPSSLWDLSGLSDTELCDLRAAIADGHQDYAGALVDQIVADGRLVVPLVRVRPGDLLNLLP